MSSTRLLRIAFTTALAAAILVPAQAASASDVMLSGSAPGNGWVVYKYRSNGAKIRASLQTGTSSYGTSTMLLIYDVKKTLVGGFGFGQGPVSEGVNVYGNLLGQDFRVYTLYRQNRWCAEQCPAGLALESPNPGTFYVVMYITGNQRDHDYEFSGEPGVQLLAFDHGPEAYLVHVQDFKGALNAHAAPLVNHPLPIATPTVHGVISGETKLTVKNTLVGALGGVGVADAMVVEAHGPGWSNRGCSRHFRNVNTVLDVYHYCWWLNLDGAERAGAGNYRFTINAKASLGIFDVTGLWVADVRIPD